MREASLADTGARRRPRPHLFPYFMKGNQRGLAIRLMSVVGALTDGAAGMQSPSTTLRDLLSWLVLSGQRTALRKARHNQSQPLRGQTGSFSLGSKSVTWVHY